MRFGSLEVEHDRGKPSAGWVARQMAEGGLPRQVALLRPAWDFSARIRRPDNALKNLPPHRACAVRRQKVYAVTSATAAMNLSMLPIVSPPR
jgi:hypothetical protein